MAKRIIRRLFHLVSAKSNVLLPGKKAPPYNYLILLQKILFNGTEPVKEIILYSCHCIIYSLTDFHELTQLGSHWARLGNQTLNYRMIRDPVSFHYLCNFIILVHTLLQILLQIYFRLIFLLPYIKLTKARFRRRTSHKPNRIQWIKFMWSTASESIKKADIIRIGLAVLHAWLSRK